MAEKGRMREQIRFGEIDNTVLSAEREIAG
jgi:hypothetical protein